MWEYILKGLKLVLCFIIAWELKANPNSKYIVYVCLAIIGVIVTRRIYERS